MEEPLIEAPHFEAEQQQPYEVIENMPAMQGPIRGWERQEIVIDDGSTSESGVQTLSPRDNSGTVKAPVPPNIIDLAVNRYGFNYAVFEDDKCEEIDVGKIDDDDSHDHFVDD